MSSDDDDDDHHHHSYTCLVHCLDSHHPIPNHHRWDIRDVLSCYWMCLIDLIRYHCPTKSPLVHHVHSETGHLIHMSSLSFSKTLILTYHPYWVLDQFLDHIEYKASLVRQSSLWNPFVLHSTPSWLRPIWVDCIRYQFIVSNKVCHL